MIMFCFMQALMYVRLWLCCIKNTTGFGVFVGWARARSTLLSDSKKLEVALFMVHVADV